MTVELVVPTETKELIIYPKPGDVVFVLGANGTGKSGLMHRFYTMSGAENLLRLTAHRQTWFTSNTNNLSPLQKRHVETRIRQQDNSSHARWKDDSPEDRTYLAIYDFVDASNVAAREIADAVKAGRLEAATALSKQDGPVKVLNDLFRSCNLSIQIGITGDDEVVASRSGGKAFSVAELSDGERSAFLIGINVLSAKRNALILVDEPELHLHRSIISPLLTQLFARRPDCVFVISTHEVGLALDNPAAQVLLLRDCWHSGTSVERWNADLLTSDASIGEQTKKDILGGRQRIIFVEGAESSLDKAIFSLIFPNISVVAKASCRDVERAVSGIRDAANLHWVKAFGIIDNDGRSAAETGALAARGIYALPVYSVESIYYHPQIQKLLATRQSDVNGSDPNVTVEAAERGLIDAVRQHAVRLAERAAEKVVRNKIFDNLPTSDSIGSRTPVNIQVDVAAVVQDQHRRIEAALQAASAEHLISNYPIRETPGLNNIVRHLGFQDREQYESAVRKLLVDDAGALAFVRGLFQPLNAALAAA